MFTRPSGSLQSAISIPHRSRVSLAGFMERLLSQPDRRVLWGSNIFFVALGVTFFGLAFWQATVLEQAIRTDFSIPPHIVRLTNPQGQVISPWKSGHWAPPEPHSPLPVGTVAISVPGYPGTLHMQWTSSSTREF